jgi:hypothetical protein
MFSSDLSLKRKNKIRLDISSRYCIGKIRGIGNELQLAISHIYEYCLCT